MLKPFINASLVLLYLGLIGCAGGPTNDASDNRVGIASSADVDVEARVAYSRAVSLLQEGRTRSAMEQFAAITQQYPNLASAHVNLGILYLKQERYEDAQQSLSKATQLRPDDAIAQNHLGIAYRQLGKFDEAKQAYAAALQTNPQYANAHLNSGILYDIYLSELAQALRHYEQYKALINGSDKQVDKWIIDLKRRLK